MNKEQLLPTCTKNGYSLNAQRLVTTLVPTCRSNLGLKPGARKTLGLSWPGERMGFRLCCCSSCSHTWRSALHMKSLSIVMTKVSTTYEIPVYRHDKGQHYKYKGTLSSFSNHEHKTHAKRPQATDSWRSEPSQPQRSYHGKTAQKHCNTNSKRRK